MNFTKYVGVSALIASTLIFSGCGSSGTSYVDDNTSVEIPVENTAPVAKAGIDQHVKTGGLVTLNSAKSYDADGDSLVYDWKIVSKPDGSTARLSSKKVSHPTFMPDVDGKYEFSLKVSDGQASSSKSYVTVVATPVNPNPVEGTPTPPAYNAKPVADAGIDQNVKAASLVTLNSAKSYDADGDSLLYDWKIVSKPDGSSARLSSKKVSHPTFMPDVDGKYEFSLKVSDGQASSSKSYVTVVVTPVNPNPAVGTPTPPAYNAKPVADAGIDENVKTKSIHDAGIVYLDGSNSSDADKDQLTYTWTFQSGPSSITLKKAKTSHPTFIAEQNGSYVVKLIVNDGTVDSVADTVTITAEIGNSKPIAVSGPIQHVKTDDTVTLDASGSRDADHDPLTYKWFMTSKPTGSNATLSEDNVINPTFEADADGDYVMKLIVNDGIVDSSPVPAVVHAATANSKPVASINNGAASVFAYVNEDIFLDANDSSDADGNTLTYSWHVKSKASATAKATFDNNTLETPMLTISENGDYVIALVVNDGTVDSDEVSIRVTTKLTNQTFKDLVADYRTDNSNTKLADYIINADTSEVTSMHYLFKDDTTFNLDIGDWNTSKVTTMFGMFEGAIVFNQDLNAWNTSKVTTMNATFLRASEFNGDISSWTTGSVTSMHRMFERAVLFNQDINAWNTSKVTDMDHMFYIASIFNQNLNKWDTSSVTSMRAMFYSAAVFDQNISAWDVSNVAEYNDFDSATSDTWIASEKPTFNP